MKAGNLYFSSPIPVHTDCTQDPLYDLLSPDDIAEIKEGKRIEAYLDTVLRRTGDTLVEQFVEVACQFTINGVSTQVEHTFTKVSSAIDGECLYLFKTIQGKVFVMYDKFAETERTKPDYKEGSFGYHWTVMLGNPDIKDTEYYGDLKCSSLFLTSLDGCPSAVYGDFDCSVNELTNLSGGPRIVAGDYDCSFNKLNVLFGAPDIVFNNFCCMHNRLCSLKGGPLEVMGSYACSHNKLETLEGCAKFIGRSLRCNDNLLHSLEGMPKKIFYNFSADNNLLRSLKHIAKDIGVYCSFHGNYLYRIDYMPELLGDGRDTGQLIGCKHNIASEQEMWASIYIKKGTADSANIYFPTEERKQALREFCLLEADGENKDPYVLPCYKN